MARPLARGSAMRVALILLLALAASASASRFESTTGTHYQHDGGKDGDAPDTCGEAGSPPLVGAHQGMLVPGDDARDFWRLEVPTAGPEQNFTPVYVTLQPIPRAPGTGAAVPADLYVHGEDRELRQPCGVLFGSSARPGVLPDQVVVDIPGLYFVEVRLPAPFSIGVGAGSLQSVEACHPMCTQDTYDLVRS